MDISRKSLISIKEILSFYSDKKYDFEVINEIISILRSDSKFDNPIYTDKMYEKSPAYTMDGVLYFSDYIFEYVQNVITKYNDFPGFNEKEAFNYFMLEILFHELAHLSQLDTALKRKSEYEVINELYYLVFFVGKRNQEHYDKNRANYVHEYNANLEAIKLLKKLFPNNKFLDYLNDRQFGLIMSYYYDKQKKMFISEKTLDAKKIEDKSIIMVHEGIPKGILISNGLPVNSKTLEKIDSIPLTRVRRKYDL